MKPLLTLVLATLLLPLVSGAVLSPDEAAVSGFASSTLGESYGEMVNAWYENGNVTRLVAGNLITPWYSQDNACGVSQLQSGGNCNIGSVNESEYCMVSDELSQVGLILSMGENETRFNDYVDTINVINSSNGQLPSWRVFVNATEGVLYPCDSRTNGNCDTASDATARIITSLFNAANNTNFVNATRKQWYYDLAVNLTDDMIAYEYNNSAQTVSVEGVTSLTYWLKAGTEATITGNDGAYSGYYQDAIIAFLQACTNTKNLTYCGVARNTTLNYLQAAYPLGNTTDTFRVPPGRSYKWDFSGEAYPICTNTCSPVQWDSVDAPRAFGLGLALYYAEQTNLTAYTPGLRSYLNLWTDAYLTHYNSVPIQYYPNGTNSSTNQSGYKAQGLQAQALLINTTQAFNTTVRNAIDHYDSTPETWDYQACAGVYGQSFSIRALGVGVGYDNASWPVYAAPAAPAAPAAAATGLAGACVDLTAMYDNFIGLGPTMGTLLGVFLMLSIVMLMFGAGFALSFDPKAMLSLAVGTVFIIIVLVVSVITLSVLCA